MKVLVIGKGGREHAIVRALAKSKEIDKIYCAPGNGGISCDAEIVCISEMNKSELISFAKAEDISYVVVTPDNPLADGMVDAFEAVGISCFGPSRKAAQIESSKVFAKQLMKKYNIPTASCEVFDDVNKAVEYVKMCNQYPTVIKADGLAFGKGVIIAQDFEEAACAINDMLVKDKFGESGNRIVIEEFLDGPEISVLCFTDGKVIKPMISSMDHKRVFDGDMGLNTGGMGAIAPNPFYTKQVASECMDKIFIPTIRAMKQEDCLFKGCLYFGLMLTKAGPKVIEYNCRFGDPETQVVLPLLKTDLFTIMQAVSNEQLEKVDVEFYDGCSACVVMAAPGYPQDYPKGMLIKNLDENGQRPGVTIYHSGTVLKAGEFKTSGGRVLCISALGENLKEALSTVYDAVDKIEFDGAHYRTDIGKKALNF